MESEYIQCLLGMLRGAPSDFYPEATLGRLLGYRLICYEGQELVVSDVGKMVCALELYERMKENVL